MDRKDIAGHYRYILHFDDEFNKKEGHSVPVQESQLFLSFFSLISQSKLQIQGSMINNVRSESFGHPNVYGFRGRHETIPDFNLHLNKLQSMDINTARQFLRSCEVYRTAINLANSHTTISFFLLCVAIECLSNKVSDEDGICNKFIEFILHYLPNKSDFDNEDEWKKVLREIYNRHRSGFTHGGKSIPEAVFLADRLGKPYIKNLIDGKEVRTPGLKWFEEIVRETLLGFLNSYEVNNKSKNDWLKTISLEYGIVLLKAKRNGIVPGHLVSDRDVELD